MGAKYQDRQTRVVPPRDATSMAGSCRVIACNTTTTAVRLDNDIFQVPAAANATGTPGSYGPALVEFSVDGGTDDVGVLFGPLSSVVANLSATSGNTVCARITKGERRLFELWPGVDKYVSARTAANTNTLRYRIVSFPDGNNVGNTV